jgi:N-acetyl-anhydromuramyl-L-alanine amidase AmpD
MATIAAPKIVDGKLIADRVTDKIESKIEKGPMAKVDALVMHQTGSDNAASSFASYKQGKAGAHFLIDKDGTIYQSARTNQTCWHVGKIQSRCYALKSCSVDELAAVKGILFNKADSYSARLSKLNTHEQAKPYPDRYPSNADSIGIEIVSGFSASKGYEDVTAAQQASASWLITTLEGLLSLTSADIYRHPQVSYKQASEAQSVKW